MSYYNKKVLIFIWMVQLERCN